MGMSIKEQVEYNKDVFAQAMQNIKKSEENKVYDNHYLNVVNTFNNELYRYFADLTSEENSLTQCTQLMWYRLYLEKKRLQKFGLRKIYNRVHPVQHKKNSQNRELVTIHYKDDGKNTICEIIDNCNSAESFYYVDSKNKKLKRYVGKKRKEYMITSSKFKTENECACQNCGAFMSVEKLIDGCDYCGTKYTLQDLQGKVSSLYEQNNNMKNRSGSPLALVMLSVTFFALGFIAPIFILFGFLLMIIAMMYVKNNGQKTTESIIKLKKKFNLLSKETLFSEIENKLFTLHYCDEQQDIKTLCDCDLGVNYKNVLFCETEKYFIEEAHFTPDNKWVSIHCRFHLKINYLKNERIEQDKEIVKFKMIRSVESLNKINSDLLVYRCKNCGSSISLLNGGRCEYCGSKMILENFDWKVTEYESDWKNN